LGANNTYNNNTAFVQKDIGTQAKETMEGKTTRRIERIL